VEICRAECKNDDKRRVRGCLSCVFQKERNYLEVYYTTQIEILQKIEELYSRIAQITAQIDFERENHEEILTQRENLLSEIISLQKQRENLELGASVEQIRSSERKIKSLILAILSDSEPLMEQAQTLHVSIKKELEGIQTANKAAQSYAAHNAYNR